MGLIETHKFDHRPPTTDHRQPTTDNPRKLLAMSQDITPFEAIRHTNPAGNEFWSSRDFAKVLGYVNYRHFVAVIAKAKTACINSGQRLEDHFVGSDQMVEIGSGAQRPLKTVMMSRYACYLVIQNADPAKEIVAQGQTYFAIQIRRQELSDEEVEEQRRLASSPEARSRIELLAMNAVRLAQEARGCYVVDVSAQKCGWDITSYGPLPKDHPVPIHPSSLILPSRNSLQNHDH